MGAKDKKGIWEDVNYYGNISFFFHRIEDFITGQTCIDDSVVEWNVGARVRGVQVERP